MPSAQQTPLRPRRHDPITRARLPSPSEPPVVTIVPESGNRPAVAVVIPTLNEARNIGWVLRHLPAGIDEVIIVDGCSTDDTVAVARAIRPDVRVVMEPRRGKGRALRAGFAAATADFVIMLDADGSMNPAEIERYVERLVRGDEFVKGSRFLAGGGTNDISLLRRLGNLGLLITANVLYGRRFTDLCYGFCAFRRASLEVLALDADGFEIETQIVVRAVKAGLRTSEVPSFEAPRIYGDSNLSTFRDGWRVFTTILRERFTRIRRPAQVPVLVRTADGGTLTIHALPVVHGRRLARPGAVARPRAAQVGPGPRTVIDERVGGETGSRLGGDRV